MFGAKILAGFFPLIAYVLPSNMDSAALLIFQGMPLPAMMVSEVVVTAVLSVAFVLVGLWRFQRIEL